MAKKHARKAKAQKKDVQFAIKKANFWKINWKQALVLALLAFILYGNSIGFDYVLDDKIVLSENNFVKKGTKGIGDIFSTESFTGYLGSQQDLVVGSRYRPLSIATFAIEYQYFGLSPRVSHFINILLYALSGIIIFRLLSALLKTKKETKWYLSIPFVAAALFILHPIHTEVVANIKSRDEILTLLLSLASLWTCIKFSTKPGLKWQAYTFLLFFLALMAKESAITFLAVIPFTLYFFTQSNAKTIRQTSIPLVYSTALYIFIRFQVIGYLLDSGKEVTALMNNPFLGTSLAEKYATITYTLGMYLKLLLFPHPLTHDYYPYQIPIVTWGNVWVILSFIAMAVVVFFFIYGLKKKWISSWAALFYLATLSIVSNVVFPIGTFMNERFVYIPSLAFTIILAYLILEKLPRILGKNSLSKVLPMVMLLIISLGYTYKTIDRVPAWENELELNKAAIKVSVNSARANQYMGYSLYREALKLKDPDEQKKLYNQAFPYVKRALEIHPTYSDALTTKAGLMAGYYQQNGDLSTLLNAFFDIQTTNPIQFVDTYLEYLDNRADKSALKEFYINLGNRLKEQGNLAKSNYYLNKSEKF